MIESMGMKAPWGALTLFWEGDRLLRIALAPEGEPQIQGEDHPPQRGIPLEAYIWLKGFIDGKERRAFPLLKDLLDEAGIIAFRRRIMEEVARIGFGKTRSYSQLAVDGGSPGGARAVGRSVSANIYPLLVPCHRVIRASGELGGFQWGLELKKRLLSWEKDLLK